MRIVNLIENTKGAEGCLYEHGLSFYIETEKHKLLADTGASEAFLANARQLGIDLRQVEHVIISHGHYDHAGGVLAFVELNPKAKIWIQSRAGDEYYRKQVQLPIIECGAEGAPFIGSEKIASDKTYYHKNAVMEKYIGMAPGIQALPQVEWVDGDKSIDEGIFLFGHVTGRKLWPAGNLELKVKKGDGFEQDTFAHEQYLVLEEAGKSVLISGCAHNGILNILDRYREIFGDTPDAVISGFHMSRKSGYGDAELELIRETARELRQLDTRFYTGHCTGELPYQVMKEIMGERLEYVHSGEEIRL